MPQDAKLGLMIGVGMVVMISVVFFRKEANGPPTPSSKSTPASVSPNSAPSGEDLRSADVGKTPIVSSTRSQTQVRRHVVRQGDTLYTLSLRYYNDETRSLDILRANQDKLAQQGGIVPGMVLLIPNVPVGGKILAEAKRP